MCLSCDRAAVLCGPLGFEDFYRTDWMTMVVDWPDKRLGCFRMSFGPDSIEQLLKGGQRSTQLADDNDDYLTYVFLRSGATPVYNVFFSKMQVLVLNGFGPYTLIGMPGWSI